MERSVILKSTCSLFPIARRHSAPHQPPLVGSATGFSLQVRNSNSAALLSASCSRTTKRRAGTRMKAPVIRCECRLNRASRSATFRSLRCDLANIFSTTCFAIALQSRGSQSSPKGTVDDDHRNKSQVFMTKRFHLRDKTFPMQQQILIRKFSNYLIFTNCSWHTDCAFRNGAEVQAPASTPWGEAAVKSVCIFFSTLVTLITSRARIDHKSGSKAENNQRARHLCFRNGFSVGLV